MNKYRPNKIELLAPCGNYHCFKAALIAGADAVYLGLDRFGARANAGNFNLEELKSALDEAHLHGVKVYLTVNTLFKASEIRDLFDFLYEPYLYGLDGVIVQDIGVVKYIKEVFPLLEVHASTQMAITDVAGVNLCKSLGIERVVPARELSLDEIKKIYKETGMELECFIHGAMCYSYSGKCLMSSFIGGRSGNRGRCAQPCRLTYDNEYLLSMKDMSTLSVLDKLIDSGIYSFKIEGRMKSPDYVYGVTSIYRKYIDMYLNGESFDIDPEDLTRLHSIYTRSGNCNGYYFEKNGQDMITISSGAYSSQGRDSLIENDKLLNISMYCKIKRGEHIAIKLSLSDAENSLSDKEFLYTSDLIPQEAINSAASEESVSKQLLKVGGSGFEIISCKIDLDEGLFISNGQLNAVRRGAIEGFRDHILGNTRRCEKDINRTSDLLSISKGLTDRIDNKKIDNKKEGDIVELNVFPMSVTQLIEVLKFDSVSGVILNYDLFESLFVRKIMNFPDKLIERIDNGLNLYIKLPYIIREDNRSFSENQLHEFIQKAINVLENEYGSILKGVYISNYESLSIVASKYSNLEIIGDIHLYSFNNLAHRTLLELGLDKSVMNVELNKRELYGRAVSGEEVICYGRIPTMISTQCINVSKSSCRKKDKGYFGEIADRRGQMLPVYFDCNSCTNIIYNSVPVYLLDENDFIRKIKPSSIRIDFTVENTKEVKDILERTFILLEGQKSRGFHNDYTKGHLNRGVD